MDRGAEPSTAPCSQPRRSAGYGTELKENEITARLAPREVHASFRRASGPAPKTRPRGSPSLRSAYAAATLSRLMTPGGSTDTVFARPRHTGLRSPS
jgi:hypothetical protein